ncbi:hypothetical protein [Nonlabens agnitus]|uniref:Uncharacterized protein n=1 Tax=Nonlabens agnitus TaxID=870484 RepID=A0A2S9WXJ2_9FLAO|nr:hypothetical protein [Nonlabens agnitus]PRP68096.1 hypothetical protein BST86_13875 [Nonlabens agnitus]
MSNTQKAVLAIIGLGAAGYAAWYYFTPPIFRILRWDHQKQSGEILFSGKRYWLLPIDDDVESRFPGRNNHMLARRLDNGKTVFTIEKNGELIELVNTQSLLS